MLVQPGCDPVAACSSLDDLVDQKGLGIVVSAVRLSNILNETKRQQILDLGSLAWSLRRTEAETGVRRETISRYLETAGIGARERGAIGLL